MVPGARHAPTHVTGLAAPCLPTALYFLPALTSPPPEPAGERSRAETDQDAERDVFGGHLRSLELFFSLFDGLSRFQSRCAPFVVADGFREKLVDYTM